MGIGDVTGRIPNPLSVISDGAFQVKVLTEAGVLRPIRPDKLARMAVAFARHGASPAGGATLAAINHPQRTALTDERGSLTFEELRLRSNALAHAFAQLGVGPGDGVGIMCRNHRGFVEASLAGAKLGASSLYLNTMFSGPQLADVVKREGPRVLVFDEEFAGLLDGVGDEVSRVIAWSEGASEAHPTIDRLIAASPYDDPDPPSEQPRFVILTSGTTGTPKGAQRSSPSGIGGLASVLAAIPYKTDETIMVATPLFHSWGFSHFVLGLSLGCTLVLRRRFDPEATLRAIEESGAEVLVVVPVMLQRIMSLPKETLNAYDLSSLRITAVSGSVLPGDLATAWMDQFGDTIYNLYGSTEVAYATIAGPTDLRAAPGTAGRPPRGTTLRLLDEDGREVPNGEVGRIFVGNDLAFEGYTGGGGKEVIDGLMSTGDVGHMDSGGRLFVDGRDDEMIVSGGENVFPREVEDLLSEHEGVEEVAVIGVPDEEFGQRLKAYVVLTGRVELSEADAKAHVKRNLAGYKTPREIEFLDELPRNATGKVLKRELVERDAERSD